MDEFRCVHCARGFDSQEISKAHNKQLFRVNWIMKWISHSGLICEIHLIWFLFHITKVVVDWICFHIYSYQIEMTFVNIHGNENKYTNSARAIRMHLLILFTCSCMQCKEWHWYVAAGLHIMICWNLLETLGSIASPYFEYFVSKQLTYLMYVFQYFKNFSIAETHEQSPYRRDRKAWASILLVAKMDKAFMCRSYWPAVRPTWAANWSAAINCWAWTELVWKVPHMRRPPKHWRWVDNQVRNQIVANLIPIIVCYCYCRVPAVWWIWSLNIGPKITIVSRHAYMSWNNRRP